MKKYACAVAFASLLSAGCGAFTGDPGPAGAPGADGKDGMPGAMGSQGLPGKDTTVSGSRIRAVYHVAEDGARTMIGWYDSDLDTKCRFGSAEDGKTRCFPTDAKNISTLYYASPTCDESSILIKDYKDCPQGDYVSIFSYAACNASYAAVIYKTGEFFQPDNLYSIDNGVCKVVVNDTSTTRRVTHIDPTAFVEAAESIE